MNANGQCTLELSARLGKEIARDTLVIRTDTRATPAAVADGPKTAEVNTIVQLDASRSRDPRAFPKASLTYKWRQVGGPATDLSSDELPDPIFYPVKPGTYTFELVFSNPIRTGTPARCSVKVAGASGAP